MKLVLKNWLLLHLRYSVCEFSAPCSGILFDVSAFNDLYSNDVLTIPLMYKQFAVGRREIHIHVMV